MSLGPVNVAKGSMGPVDYAIHPIMGDTTFDFATAHIPLLRRRVQVVAEGLGAGGTFSVLVRPVGASAFMPCVGPLTAGQWAWIYAGGSSGGVLIDAVRVTVALGGGAAPRVILASTPEGL